MRGPRSWCSSSQVIEPFRAGKHNDALSIAQRALALGEQQLGPEHEYVGEVLLSLRWLHATQGRTPTPSRSIAAP